MNIRYFFVADVCQRNQITLEYCPTNEMIGDFFTKPLGGAKFRRFRNIIMNITLDEHGPVDVDELTIIHQNEMQRQFEMKNNIEVDEPTKNIRSKMSSVVDSQECVGDRGYDREHRHNPSCANMRAAHKNPRNNRIPPGGRAHKLRYAQAVAE